MKKISLLLIAITASLMLSVCQKAKTPDKKLSGSMSSSKDTVRKFPGSIKELWQVANSIDMQTLLKDRVNDPQFFVEGNTFAFYPGAPPSLSDQYNYTTAEMPVLIPLARIMQLEDLRKFISQHPEADPAFWDPYFQKSFDIIEGKCLPIINSDTIPLEVIYNRVTGYDSVIDRLFKEAAEAFAQSHGFQQRRPNIMALTKYRTQVSFVINPEPADVYIVTETGYEIAKALKINPKWTLSEGKPQLGGLYKIKVEWPDNTQKEYPIDVKSAGAVFTFNK